MLDDVIERVRVVFVTKESGFVNQDKDYFVDSSEVFNMPFFCCAQMDSDSTWEFVHGILGMEFGFVLIRAVSKYLFKSRLNDGSEFFKCSGDDKY